MYKEEQMGLQNDIHFGEERKQAAMDRAGEAFGDAHHCAEAVVLAVMESLGQDSAPVLPLATAFGGGMGKTFEEACGALSGAMLVIGHLHGRSAAGQSWETAASMAAEARGSFVQRNQCTRCKDLRDKFGDEQMARCREVVKLTVADLLDSVELYGGDEEEG